MKADSKPVTICTLDMRRYSRTGVILNIISGTLEDMFYGKAAAADSIEVILNSKLARATYEVDISQDADPVIAVHTPRKEEPDWTWFMVGISPALHTFTEATTVAVEPKGKTTSLWIRDMREPK